MEPGTPETAGTPLGDNDMAGAIGLPAGATASATGLFAGRVALAYTGMVSYALLAATARPLTLPAAFAILMPGSALLWWGVRRAPDQVFRAGWTTTLTWIAVGLLFCVWELVAFFSGNDPAHPTFSILTDPVFATYPGRVAGYLLWLATGAWLVTR